MKKNLFIGIFFVALAMVGCAPEEQNVTIDHLNVKFAGFKDQNGTKLSFPDEDLCHLLFDDGDRIYVNNIPFDIHQVGDDWVAQRGDGSSVTLDGDAFYCLYYDPQYCSKKAWASGSKSYTITFGTADSPLLVNGFNIYNTGIVLEGMTEDTVVTMRPMCAIIRFDNNTYGNVINMYVGFDDDVMMNKANVTPANVNSAPIFNGTTSFYSGINYEVDGMSGVPSYFGSMAKATLKNAEQQDPRYSTHVIVPLDGPKQTSIYMMAYNNGNYYYNKISEMTIEPGRV